MCVLTDLHSTPHSHYLTPVCLCVLPSPVLLCWCAGATSLPTTAMHSKTSSMCTHSTCRCACSSYCCWSHQDSQEPLLLVHSSRLFWIVRAVRACVRACALQHHLTYCSASWCRRAGCADSQPALLLVCGCVSPFCAQAVAKSFGFSGPPKVSLNIESKAAHGRRAKKVQQVQGGAGGADYRRFKPASGHAFSASNPYGVRAKGDNRQLARF